MADAGYERTIEHLRSIGVNAKCICHRCIRENDLRHSGQDFSLASSIMVLCPICGNKRCPKASDHRLACTGSNEPGQEGSMYAGARVPTEESD